MRPHKSRTTIPTTTSELLLLLRRTRLLTETQIQRLIRAWPANDSPEPHVEELIRAGLLTRYQGTQLLQGQIRNLSLGPFLLLDQLGVGASGQVFKAEHRLLKRLVALKVFSEKESLQAHFEMEIVGNLSHPHLVAAYDARQLRGRFVLVLEYIEGVDLQRFLRETGPISWPFALTIARQTASALAYLHEHRLVHRDVKPANLLLTHPTHRPEQPLLKLLDLGLVCPASQASKERCGTPDYMAPECGTDGARIDIRSDLYSLGCTLYELLSGRVPFPGGGWTGKLLRHQIEVPEPLAALRPELPSNVIQVIERLMARDPGCRFANPAELLKALDQLDNPPSLPEKVISARVKPKRLRLAVAALCLLAILIGTGAGSVARTSFAMSIRSSEQVELPRPQLPKPVRRPCLASQIETARDGSVVEIPSGRHLIPPIHLRGRKLTLRGAAGSRPVLVRAHQSSWDALVQSDRALILEHLELQAGDSETYPAPLIAVDSAELSLRDCVLNQRSTAPAISFRRGAKLCLDHTKIVAREQGVAIEASPNVQPSIQLHSSELLVREATGPGVLLWATEGSQIIRLQMKQSKVRAGRILVGRSLSAPIQFTALESQFIFHQALVSLDDSQLAWPDHLVWKSSGNRYEATGAWLRVDGQPGPAFDEATFAQLWRGRP